MIQNAYDTAFRIWKGIARLLRRRRVEYSFKDTLTVWYPSEKMGDWVVYLQDDTEEK